MKGSDDLCYNCGNDNFTKYYNTELNKQYINFNNPNYNPNYNKFN